MPPLTVSNTGPLIALAKVDQLPLLKSVFGRILIAPAVRTELLAGSTADVERLRLALGDFVDTDAAPPLSRELADEVRDLGEGEREAIALALHRRAMLVIDDQAARSVARKLGVVITGTVGVLVEAKAIGIIPLVVPVLQAMRANGYFLSDALIGAAAGLAGE